MPGDMSSAGDSKRVKRKQKEAKGSEKGGIKKIFLGMGWESADGGWFFFAVC